MDTFLIVFAGITAMAPAFIFSLLVKKKKADKD